MIHKKLEIKNPLLRGLAGTGIFTSGVVVTLVIILIIFYGMGQLTESIFLHQYKNFHYTAKDYDFGTSCFWGFVMTVSIILSCAAIFGLIKGGLWMGNKCFKPVVVVEN